ncbi:hypothetical protein D0861_01701 [Hortaea werneckii]|uniref:N-acetyltransferase domain-containing protein n=1 Tax=Hortaea werneckii TaxID=91943 RepID=A0A3M7FZL3_HORWE|nr:hypothetical protein KC361_g2830 [Hortaea werneckii]KAI7511975.1 hypothetical protein KC347_g2887 [Hortaea werneckii]RMY93811.1 hypothetical protein D0861_01701 [Hortaea werneckii]
MPQSSLTAWLNKPATVKTAPVTTPRQDEKPSAPSQTGEAATTQHPAPPTQESENEKPTSTTTSYGKNPEQNSSKTPPAFQTSLPSLPPNIHLRACTKADIPALKRLNALLLPIPYPETFYREILQDEVTNNLTLLALWHDDPALKDQEKGILVGAVRGRLIPSTSTPPSISTATKSSAGSSTLPPPTATAGTANPNPPPPENANEAEGPKLLYLSTLVLLSPYRRHGIMTHMLRQLIQRGVHSYGVSAVGAHVWEANAEGLEWYERRGFAVVGREEGYYRRLQPQGAMVVRKGVGVGDLLG